MKKLVSIWNSLKILGWLVIGVFMYVFYGMFIIKAIQIILL